MKKGRYFSYIKNSYIAYNYPKKEKIAVISEDISKDNDSQKK